MSAGMVHRCYRTELPDGRRVSTIWWDPIFPDETAQGETVVFPAKESYRDNPEWRHAPEDNETIHRAVVAWALSEGPEPPGRVY
jgi:hypothetical protein